MKKDEISKELRYRIISGEYALHSAIPPERVLTGLFGVSRITVRAAIDNLVQEGILERNGRSGTIVRRVPSINNNGDVRENRQKTILYIYFSSIPDSRIEQSSKNGVIYRGIENYANRMGYSLVAQTGENYRLHGLPDFVDGIIAGGKDLPLHLPELNSYGLPVVFLSQLPAVSAHVVCWDNFGAGSIAAARAAELGHKKIALTALNYRDEEHLQPSFRRRIAGFMDMAPELGLDVCKLILDESEFADTEKVRLKLCKMREKNDLTLFVDCSGLHPDIFGGTPVISIGATRIFDHPATDFFYCDEQVGYLAAERLAALMTNPHQEKLCLMASIRTKFTLKKLYA